jgi:hypothetical protein
LADLDDELAAIDEQLALEAEVPALCSSCCFAKVLLTGLCCSLRKDAAEFSLLSQLGESEVPAYLQPEEPATVAPAQPAAATGEQVDEFGLPIAQAAT